MRKLAIFSIMIAFFLLGCRTLQQVIATATPPSQTATGDEYAVYSAYIDARFTNTLLVINDHTQADIGSGSLDDRMKYISQEMKGVDRSTLDDFKAKNAQSSLLSNQFKTSKKIVLVTQEEMDSIFQGSSAWETFYQKYPDSQGRMTLSRVGFNDKGDQALLYMGNMSYSLAGAGYYVLMEKSYGVWTIAQELMAWIS